MTPKEKPFRLIDRYTIHEISVATQRLCSFSEAALRDTDYNIEQISARLSLPEELIKHLLDLYFVPQGIFTNKWTAYRISDDLK
ncbi:Uncharacterised protein [uncultured archaeon]|nr:Uncharacterised protein [uncultured archaeon]